MSTPSKFEFKITPHWDAANAVLTFETNVSGQIYQEAVSFKDRVVREKLIQLGWTPPQSNSDPWSELDRSGGGGHTADEIARASGERW